MVRKEGKIGGGMNVQRADYESIRTYISCSSVAGIAGT